MKDITNQVFGSLTAIKPMYSKNHMWYWKFKCKCGKEIICRANTITYVAKHSKKPQFPSCGCEELKQKTKHGFRTVKNTHPLYRIYRGMITRCYDPNCPEYKLYGAKGVRVCDEWLNHPEEFCKWGLQNGWFKRSHLDKDILSDKLNIHPHIYSPQTCQFVSCKTNVGYATNRDNYGKHPNIKLSHEEVCQLLDLRSKGMSGPKLAKMFNINPSSVYKIIRLQH